MPNQTHYLVDYHPVNRNGTRNPNFNSSIDSKKILDFKDPADSKHRAAVTYFSGKLQSYCTKNNIALDSYDLVTLIPKSQANKISNGLNSLLTNVCAGIVKYEPRILVRHTTITSMHNGGFRDPSTHIATIFVDRNLLNGAKNVLLVDDILTSGSTSEGCCSILQGAGVINIDFIALGRTV